MTTTEKNIAKMTGFDKGFNKIKPSEKANVHWMPHYKQALALACPAFELLYGGAAGGGKSDFLLMDYYAGVNLFRQHWRGILFRRTYAELEELIERATALYAPLGGRLTNNGKDFTFPTGARLKFRYLEHDSDVNRYQGHQYTWIGFDELGNYASDYCWRYMISRCRSAAGVKCYMRASANPGGVGHAWIKSWFVDGFEPGKIHTVTITIAAGAARTEGAASAAAPGLTLTRCFIPAKLEDNPSLMRNDPGYAQRLLLLPSHQYRALREGDWDIFAGQVFGEWRREQHVAKPFALPQDEWRRFYCLDWGYSKPYAVVKMAVNGDGKAIQYGEIYGCRADEANVGTRESSPEVAAKAWEQAAAEGVTDLVADPAAWGKQDNVAAPIDAFRDAGFRCHRANNERVPGLQRVHDYLTQEDEHGKPMFQCFDSCFHTIRTITTLLPSPTNPEDVDSRLEDHLYDALRYALMSDFASHPARHLAGPQGRRAAPRHREKAAGTW